MADYIYLLENRLSPEQQQALLRIREIALAKNMTVFLTGGAVRDLTSGSPVRDLDVSLQGNVLKLKKELEKAGGVLQGEHDASQTLFYKFPGGVRVEIASTRSETYPKPGKPVYQPASILDDLRRRDFTANAMALSLNDGSYGLLMDPLNGIADIEARHLKLVSNYGFIEDPARLIRAARFKARLGWDLEEKTATRYQTAKDENYIGALSAFHAGYELEEILHEEDPLKVLQALEAEGWMQHLFPAWSSAKVDTAALNALHEVLVKLQMQGVTPDASAANATLLTAKLPAAELAALKKKLARPGFVADWEGLDHEAKEFAKLLTSKEAALPSAAWKLLTTHSPEAVLWLGYTSKSAAVLQKYENFFTVWPEARQKIPYAILLDMRIVPDIPAYQELLRGMFFEFMDGKLTTEEEIRAYLEPHSPPAPPPPVIVRRPRAAKKAAGKKGKQARIPKDELPPDEIDDDGELPDEVDDDEDVEKDLPDFESEDIPLDDSGPLPEAEEPEAAEKKAAPVKSPAVKEPVKVSVPAPVKKAAEKSVPAKVAAKAPVKAVTVKTASKPAAKPVVKKVAGPVKKVAAKPVAKKAVVAKKAAAPVKKAAKAPVKAVKKVVAKKAAPVKKAVPAKKVVAKKAVVKKKR